AGVMGAQDVTNLAVTCLNREQFIVQGTVSGLQSGSVTLALNGDATQTVSADGSYSFTPPVFLGDQYAVTVTQQPAGRVCVLNNASGIVGSAAPVVNATCYPAGPYHVSATVSGLTGSLRVKLNGSERVTVTGSGSSMAVSFSTPLLTGQSYRVLLDDSLQ